MLEEKKNDWRTQNEHEETAQKMRFRVQATGNETFLATVDNETDEYDNSGAICYVVVVVLIYGLSIVMMIASHIRRNKQDGHLRSYLKEMTLLRKKSRREHLLEKMTNLVLKSGPPCKQKNEETSFYKSSTREATMFGGRLISESETDEISRGLLSKASTSDCEDYIPSA